MKMQLPWLVLVSLLIAGCADTASSPSSTTVPESMQGASDRQRGPDSGFDSVAFFERLDEDGDGKLTGEEISERMRDNLAQIDTDEDGTVSLEEFQARMSQPRPGGGRGMGMGGGGRGMGGGGRGMGMGGGGRGMGMGAGGGGRGMGGGARGMDETDGDEPKGDEPKGDEPKGDEPKGDEPDSSENEDAPVLEGPQQSQP